MEPTKIILGGKDYAIRPLTLGQLRVAMPLFAKTAGLLSEAASMDAAIDIVAAGLSRDHKEMTRDELLEQEITVKELAEAIAAIASLSGLVPKVPAPGEAPAAASTGQA